MKRHRIGLGCFCVLVAAVLLAAAVAIAETLTLKECLEIGLKNYEPLQMAEEEVELARLKRQEATRSFFPALSLKAEQSEGKLDRSVSPDFEEKMYGAAMTYDILQGGRAAATYRQAVHSHEAAERSREKTWQEFLHNMRESYWRLAAAQVNLREREKAQIQIKADLKMVTEQYVLDLAVKQQFLGVKGQYLQANTQYNEAKKTLAQARWNLAKALGLKKAPDFDVLESIPFKKLEVDLEACLRLAAAHRPDLLMQNHMVEMARQQKSVARAGQFPVLSLNGFIGRSGAAYESESLKYREDWNVNARLTQRFAASSLNVFGSRIKTSPKLGESSRTNTETQGLDVKILDSLPQRTDAKRADLDYRREKMKRNDLEKDIAMEIETAYYDFQQAILQVEFTEEDVKLAGEELKAAESKRKYGMAEVLEVAKIRNRAAESRAARANALASYQVALAALNRAVGITDKFVVE